MTSATTGPATGTGGRHAVGHGYGLVLFASVLLVIVGCFNLIYGIAAIANSHVFTANAHYVFGSLRTWGWITLIIGGLQVLAAGGVLAGNQLARWFAVAVVGPQRHRPDVLHPRLPILVPDDHRGGRGRAVRAVRLRQPREPGRLALVRGLALLTALAWSYGSSPGPRFRPGAGLERVQGAFLRHLCSIHVPCDLGDQQRLITV